jgi:hypothetical protein
MKRTTLILFTLIFSNSLLASALELYNKKLIDLEKRVDVQLNRVELAPKLNDYNTFYFGNNDFEMFIRSNNKKEIEFDLDANDDDKKKSINLIPRKIKFEVDLVGLNKDIQKRLDSLKLKGSERLGLERQRLGEVCLIDDSLFMPEIISTSYYGCFDLASVVQEMISLNVKSKEVAIIKNTTFPRTNDPAKAKLFKSWYTITISE